MFSNTILFFVFYIFTVSLTWSPVNALQILAVEYIPGKSHWNFMSAILQTLVDNGHNVTVFTPFPEGDRVNYTEFDLSNDLPMKVAMNAVEIFQTFSKTSIMLPLMMNMSRKFCEIVHEKHQMKNILENADSNYDIVITEILVTECASYVAAKLNLPLIYLIPSPMITSMEHVILGDISNPATVSHLLAHHAVPRTFTQRFSNLILLVYSVFIKKQKELELKKIDPQPYDLVETIQPSLIFTNTHYITDAPRPIPPNVIQAGGIHLKTPETIPDDILKFIEDSPHGVIYFTFGSVVSMSTLPENIQKAFVEVLSQVPQRILWKYEGEMADKPSNVMTRKWFPQRDILLHPKIKLFISHGGISGVYEAVDAGVPVLGFPLFYDQPRNIENLVDAGMAISMNLMSVTKDNFFKSVLELINNEKYIKNAKIASKRFKDRPMSAAQLVAYWTEYVIRHKGAPHLKSQALNLTWYQYFLLDVIGVLLILVFIVFFITYRLLKFIYKYFLNDSKKIKTKSE